MTSFIICLLGERAILTCIGDGYVVSGRAGSVAPHRRVLTGLRKLGAEYRTRFAAPSARLTETENLFSL